MHNIAILIAMEAFHMQRGNVFGKHSETERLFSLIEKGKEFGEKLSRREWTIRDDLERQAFNMIAHILGNYRHHMEVCL